MQGKPGKPWWVKRGVTESEQGVFRETVGKLLLEFKKAEEIVIVSGFVSSQEAKAKVSQGAAPQGIWLGIFFRGRVWPGLRDGGGQGGEIRLPPGIVGHDFKNFLAAGAAICQKISFIQLDNYDYAMMVRIKK